jgi:tetratricopeptide (TPR) repeat protein
LRLSPQDPNRFAFLTTRGTAALVLERYDEAAAWLAQARRLNPDYRAALRLLVAALMLGGDAQQARALAEEFMALEPEFSVAEFGRWYPLQEPHLGRVLDALRAAGMSG